MVQVIRGPLALKGDLSRLVALVGQPFLLVVLPVAVLHRGIEKMSISNSQDSISTTESTVVDEGDSVPEQFLCAQCDHEVFKTLGFWACPLCHFCCCFGCQLQFWVNGVCQKCCARMQYMSNSQYQLAAQHDTQDEALSISETIVSIVVDDSLPTDDDSSRQVKVAKTGGAEPASSSSRSSRACVSDRTTGSTTGEAGAAEPLADSRPGELACSGAAVLLIPFGSPSL